MSNDNDISKVGKSQIEFFSGKGGDDYTERNLDSINQNLNPISFMYNMVKTSKARTILEVGCGAGHNLTRLREISNLEVYGIDINKKALEHANKLYSFAKFQEGSIFDIPFPDNFIDLVFCRGVLIHIPPEDRLKAMKEMLRVSKKNILTLEYDVEEKDEFSEMVEWQGEKDRLWRINMKKYWKYFPNVEIKMHEPLAEEHDTGKNTICLIVKKN